MGFTCEFLRTKRFKDLGPKDINLISRYLSYENNAWAKEHYPSFKEYVKENSFNKQEVEMPDKEGVDFYKGLLHASEYDNQTIWDNTDYYWCSNGACFHDWFKKKTKLDDYYGTKEVDRDMIVEAIKHFREELKDEELVQVVLERAFTENDEEIITSIPCDGIEGIDEEGNLKRIYNTEYVEESDLYVPKKGYRDIEKVRALESLIDALIELLISTDFEKEIVVYEGGW